MRYSRQRQQIYQFVCDSGEHPTAQMVYDALREAMPRLSLGTVYRNLNQLLRRRPAAQDPAAGRRVPV